MQEAYEGLSKIYPHRERILVYINIEQVLFEEAPEELHVKATSDRKEIKELIEVGFQYVCEKDALMFFRKRK